MDGGIGARVVVLGQGIGRVTALTADAVTVVLDGGGDALVARTDTEHFLRPVVDSATARRLLARLGERCTEDRSLPRVRSLREVARASLENQVEYLRWYFRRKQGLFPREADILVTVGDLVLAELAVALDVDVRNVRTAAKTGKPLARVEPRTLPPAPALPHLVFLRSFWLADRALVSEWPEQLDGGVTVRTSPGAWHAYTSEPDAEHAGLLLLHAAHAASTEARHRIELEVGAASVDGGEIGVLDAVSLTDGTFSPDEVQHLRERGEGYEDRGASCGTHGDGDHHVLVDDLDAATGIFISF